MNRDAHHHGGKLDIEPAAEPPRNPRENLVKAAQGGLPTPRPARGGDVFLGSVVLFFLLLDDHDGRHQAVLFVQENPRIDTIAIPRHGSALLRHRSLPPTYPVVITPNLGRAGDWLRFVKSRSLHPSIVVSTRVLGNGGLAAVSQNTAWLRFFPALGTSVVITIYLEGC